MRYEVIIKKQAKKKLLGLPNNQRHRIAERIAWLGENPDDPKLDVKKLVGMPHYRLRVGDWRVIFDREN